MIERMKKLSLLIHRGEKDRFLSDLQELGVVHVVENPAGNSEILEKTIAGLRAFQRIEAALKRISSELKLKEVPPPDSGPQEIAAEYERLAESRETAMQRCAALRKNCALLAPWGDFDPALRERLAKAGVSVRFFETGARQFDAMPLDDVPHDIISRDGGRVRFVVFERGTPPAIAAEETVLPAVSLTEATREIDGLEKEIAGINSQLGALCGGIASIRRQIDRLTSDMRFETARLSMEEAAAGNVLVLLGWVPVKIEARVKAFLEQYAAWYSLEEPENNDDIPVLLRNKPFPSLFEPITKILSLPDYFELDPTPFFAPFYAFFFGLCLGDVGYGLIILIGSILLARLVPPKMKGVFKLGMVLGGMTMAAGLLLNTFFGHEIFNLPGAGNAFFSAGTGVALLGPYESNQGMVFPAMTFALYLGVLQILFGMALSGVNRLRNDGPIYSLSAIARMLMVAGAVIFLAHSDFMSMGVYRLGIVPVGALLCSIPLKASLWLVVTGLVLLFLFNDPSKKLPVRFGLGFWELYQFLQGLAGDGLSYVRLFALGLAGGLLGAAINEIAFMLITDSRGVVHYGSPLIVFTLLILVAGHTLNLAISALGAFVHSLRLTFVEFYNNLRFKGGARAYAPLARIGESK